MSEDASGRDRERGRQGKGREGVCIHTRWQDRKADRFPQARCPVRDLPCGKDEDISSDYLSRREYVHRKQTYISYETYRRLARILPLLSEGMTVPAFLDNVLNRHLDEHGDVLDEMVRTGTRNSR